MLRTGFALIAVAAMVLISGWPGAGWFALAALAGGVCTLYASGGINLYRATRPPRREASSRC